MKPKPLWSRIDKRLKVLSGIIASFLAIAGVGYTAATQIPTKEEMVVVQLQMDDIYASRLKGIVKESAPYEKKLERGEALRPAEKQRYDDLKEEYKRVRQLQQGK